MNSNKNIRKAPSVVRQFKKACDDLAEAINKQLFDDSREWSWVGNQVGGICDFEEVDLLNPEEMVLILESEMTYEQYAEWRDANIEYSSRKGHINLYSWIRGCRHEMLADKIDYSEQ